MRASEMREAAARVADAVARCYADRARGYGPTPARSELYGQAGAAREVAQRIRALPADADDETDRLAAERRAVYVALVSIVGSPPPENEACSLALLAETIARRYEVLRERVRRLEEAAEAVLTARDWRSGDGDCGEPCDHCTTRRVLAAVLTEGREGGETRP